VNSLADILQN